MKKAKLVFILTLLSLIGSSGSRAEEKLPIELKQIKLLSDAEKPLAKDQYLLTEEKLVSKSNYLILMGMVLVMIIIIIFFLYRSFQIKRRFEELVYRRISEEISFMNAHEVRKYLSNIMGIIMVIQNSDDKLATYSEMEKALHDSIKNLDTAIRDMGEKIKDYKTASYRKTN